MSVAAELPNLLGAVFVRVEGVFPMADFPCGFVTELWELEEDDVALSPLVEEDEVGLLDRRARLSTIVVSWQEA
jgi:hypothetical protein